MASRRDLLESAYRYALALTHHSEDAEDLVHDAWLSAQGRWLQPSKRYLYTAIRHRWIDRARRRSREAVFAEIEPDDTAVVDPPSPIDQVALEAALAELRPREREAVYLMSVEGWTAKEAAKLMDAPRGTVLSLAHRAKRKLTEALKQEVNRGHTASR